MPPSPQISPKIAQAKQSYYCGKPETLAGGKKADLITNAHAQISLQVLFPSALKVFVTSL